ncbi:ABC-three component system middle component 1 [Pseudalkalibacillus decolorationis]|uniref:ABC-three component system middle component 1 n=1 Tax=Pseudalkalibacillus decolorationis TaxID=163879 RepID=UPI002147FC8C|nr:ABC-three component system middle component 1 [Pseudalkalibacillus decolorationis]
MTYAKTLDKLVSLGFDVLFSDIFHPNMAYCYKEPVGFILKKYNGEVSQEQIIIDAVEVRNKIKKINHNIWNTYFLVCFGPKFKGNTPFSIERDARGLRKYVIQDLTDLDRIPYTDTRSIERIDDPFHITLQLLENENGEVGNLINFLMKNDGAARKLNKEEVRLSMIKYLGLENISHED